MSEIGLLFLKKIRICWFVELFVDYTVYNACKHAQVFPSYINVVMEEAKVGEET